MGNDGQTSVMVLWTREGYFGVFCDYNEGMTETWWSEARGHEDYQRGGEHVL